MNSKESTELDNVLNSKYAFEGHQKLVFQFSDELGKESDVDAEETQMQKKETEIVDEGMCTNNESVQSNSDEKNAPIADNIHDSFIKKVEMKICDALFSILKDDSAWIDIKAEEAKTTTKNAGEPTQPFSSNQDLHTMPKKIQSSTNDELNKVIIEEAETIGNYNQENVELLKSVYSTNENKEDLNDFKESFFTNQNNSEKTTIDDDVKGFKEHCRCGIGEYIQFAPSSEFKIESSESSKYYDMHFTENYDSSLSTSNFNSNKNVQQFMDWSGSYTGLPTQNREKLDDNELNTLNKGPQECTGLHASNKEPLHYKELNTTKKEPLDDTGLNTLNTEPVCDLGLYAPKKEPLVDNGLNILNIEPMFDVGLNTLNKKTLYDTGLYTLNKGPIDDTGLNTPNIGPLCGLVLNTRNKEPLDDTELHTLKQEALDDTGLYTVYKESLDDTELHLVNKASIDDILALKKNIEPLEDTDLHTLYEETLDNIGPMKPKQKPLDVTGLPTLNKETFDGTGLLTATKEPLDDTEALKTTEKVHDFRQRSLFDLNCYFSQTKASNYQSKAVVYYGEAGSTNSQLEFEMYKDFLPFSKKQVKSQPSLADKIYLSFEKWTCKYCKFVNKPKNIRCVLCRELKDD